MNREVNSNVLVSEPPHTLSHANCNYGLIDWAIRALSRMSCTERVPPDPPIQTDRGKRVDIGSRPISVALSCVSTLSPIRR